MEPRPDSWEAVLFGIPRLRHGSRDLKHFQTRKTTLLFNYLVAFPRPHLREEIIDLLWPDADVDTGRRRLSHTLWQIRQNVTELSADQDIVVADRHTLGIDADIVMSDVSRFRQLLRHAATLENDSPQQVETLEQAVALYGDSGGFLSGFYEDWVLAERRRLLYDYLGALGSISRSYERLRQWTAALRAAERALAADPLIEASHQSVIRLLAASGNQAAAQRQYQDLTRLFARDLDAVPSPATAELVRRLQSDRESAAATAEPAPEATPGIELAPLPLPLTTLYGREDALRELSVLFEQPAMRLVTLVGTGGVGKTRLAIEFAHKFAVRNTIDLPSAVAFVALADIHEPRLIAETIADALSANGALPPIQRIIRALTPAVGGEPPTFLLVLDNAEHVAEAVGAVAVELLARVARLRVLVTSQRPLSVGGEREFELLPLELPSSPHDRTASVELFLNRAQSVRPDYPTTDTSLADVARLCARLEGLPLAIELCAGWAQTLSTKQMLQMLERRFELLVSRRSDIPQRHRTLHATIEYSYLQLSGELRQFFVQLSVFRDGWTLAAVADVCMGGSISATLAALAQLRERSLIVGAEADAGEGMRFRMLESLRDFATEQRTIAQDVHIKEAHAAYFSRFIVEAVQRQSEPDHLFWAKRIQEELENIRATLEYLVASSDVGRAWTVGDSILNHWRIHRYLLETRQWLERMLVMAKPEEDDEVRCRLRAKLMNSYSDILCLVGDFPGSIQVAEQALIIGKFLDDGPLIVRSKSLIGVAALLSDDLDRAQSLLMEAIPLARTLGDEAVLAAAVLSLGRVALAQQDWALAWNSYSESLRLNRQQNHAANVSTCLLSLGLVARYQGNYSVARDLMRDSLKEHDREKREDPRVTVHLVNMGTVERLDRRYAESLDLLTEAVRRALLSGERRVLAWGIKELGHLAISLKVYGYGLQLLSSADTMRAGLGMSFKPFGAQDIARDKDAAFAALGEANASACWAMGAAENPEPILMEAQPYLAKCLSTDENKSALDSADTNNR